MAIKAKFTTMVLLLAIGVAVTGCSAMQRTRTVDSEQQLQEKAQEVSQLQQSMEDLEAEMNRQKAEIAVQEKAVEEARHAAVESEERARQAEAAKSSTKIEAPTDTVGAGLMPPNAKPGECYARVFVPPVYETDTESVLKREASERIEVVPAEYNWADEKVVVQEASERIEVVPATYKWLEEKVLVKAESTRLEEVPAQYEWVEEKILVEPAKKVWKKGRGPIEKVDNATGEIMCLVEEAAKFETVRKHVQKAPATVRKVNIAAEYKTVRKQVIDKPATTRKVEIPAKYETVRVNKMVTQPQERRIEIPAEYQTVRKTRQVSEGRVEWRPVLCQTNMSRDVIMQIQRALQRAGHDPGPIDGIYGRQTGAAARSYQKASGLATGGLTLNTIKKLGIEL